MAGAISSLYVEFSASTKKFADAMGEVTRTVKEVDKVIKPIKDRMADLGRGMTAGITVPLLALGAAAFSSASKIDEAMDSIRAQTGATDKALAGLGTDFRAVFAQIPNSIEDASKAIGTLASRTGLAGKPLQDLAVQMLNVSRLTKTDINETIAASTRVFGDWKIATDKQGAAMDFLFRVGQKTGIGFSALTRSVQQFGVPLREMGFSFEQSAALLGQFEKEGVNADVVMAALRKSLATLGKAGVTDAAAALGILTEQIQNAGTASQANGIAMTVFGAKAGPTLAAAIREGHFAIKDLLASLQNSQETINKAAEATLSFSEKFDILKHKAMEALEPIGVQMLNALERMIPTAERAAARIAALADSFSKLSPGAQDAILGTAAFLAILGPGITVVTKLSSTIIGLVALVSKLVVSFVSLGEVMAAGSLLTAVRSYSQLSATIGLIAAGGAAATAGLVLLAAAVGTAIGLFVNWAIEGSRFRKWIDEAVVSVEKFVGLTGEWGNGQKAIVEATSLSANATKKLVDELTAHGIAVDKTRLSDGAYIKSLSDQRLAQINAANAAAGHGSAMEGAGKAATALGSDMDALNKLLKTGGEEAKIFDQAVKGMVDSVFKDSEETKILVTALGQLSAQHISALDIREKLGKQILANVQGLILEGKAVPQVLQKYADLTKQQELYSRVTQQFQKDARAAVAPVVDLEMKLAILAGSFNTADIVQTYADEIVNVTNAWTKAGHPLDSFMQGMHDAAQAIVNARDDAERFKGTLDDLQASINHVFPEQGITEIDPFTGMTKIMDTLTALKLVGQTAQSQIPGVIYLSKKQLDAMKQGAEVAAKIQEFWKRALNNVVSDFASGITDMIFRGKSFADMMKKIFQDLAETIINVLVEGAFTKIAAKLTGLLSGTKLGSIFGIGGKAAGGAAAAASGGGAAAAAGAGGTAGGGATLAAFATNPITIGVAAAGVAALAIKHFVGEGRKTANQFTQGPQIDFDQHLSALVNSFDQAKAAGTLTLDEAKTTKQAITDLWSAFIDTTSQFAAQGKNQAKVAAQAMAKYTQTFGANLANVFTDINGGISTLQNQTTAATTAATNANPPGIPDTGRAVSASSIFADAVDAFKSVVDKIGTVVSGGGSGAPPINISLTSAPQVTVVCDSADLAFQVRDVILPEALKDLSMNMNGVADTLIQIIKNKWDGNVTTGATPA